MNRVLRIARILVSLAVFFVLSAGLTFSIWYIPGVCDILINMQLGQAIFTMSIGIFAGWLLVTLIFGRVYCSTVCPLGTLQDISARAVRLGRRGHEKVYHYQQPSTVSRVAFLALLVVSLATGMILIPSVIEPSAAFIRICAGFFNPMLKFAVRALGNAGIYSHYAAIAVTTSVAASIAATFLFAVVTVVSAHSGRTLCNSVCPIGTILGFVSRYSIFQINIDTDKCTQCRRCEYVCKAHCINMADHTVDSSRCVACFDCINVCRDDAIHYTTDRKRLSDPLMQRTGVRGATPKTSVEGADACASKIKPTEKNSHR